MQAATFTFINALAEESKRIKQDRKLARQAGEKDPATIKVARIFGITDNGPCDRGQGSAVCPHCGAFGRYVVSFVTEDGVPREAMKGCFARWAKSPLAFAYLALLEKEAANREKGWALPQAESKAKAAIQAFWEGTGTEAAANDAIKQWRLEQDLRASRKGWGRR